MEAFQRYFNAVKSLEVSDATEHTLRGALENLLQAIAKKENAKIKVIHEPKKDKTGLGAPDFKFKLNEAILGYLENKKVGDNLDAVLKSSQIVKYKRLSSNIILTNYLEWILLKDGQIVKRETLCYPNDVGYHRARLDPDKAAKVSGLITSFYSTPPEKIAKARVLSPALAVRCHELRDFLLEELQRQQTEHQEGKLYGLYIVFKRDVFHALDLKEFADAFAQTLGYGLFLAKLNAGDHTPVTLQNAKQHIPGNFELIRELVDFLDELERAEYHGIKWLVEEILSIMNTLNLAAIHEDLAFTKSQRSLFEPTEEERLLFSKDPYIYFYEDFLKAYDKDTRKGRGIYYTPPPVVNFIIRAVNSILKDNFGIAQGLADRRRVTVLDFATGTGTFLVEVLQQIFEEVSEGIRDQVIQQHVLKNLYGFEYLIAPYTIAHLKLSQFLHDKGYALRPNERLQIYLTNTLEPIEPQANFLLPALSREVEAAQEIKEKPILVITGNPPYSGHSKNNGEWITKLIDDYKKVDGKPLGEKNPKWLQDDYVKFIRFAQSKMQDVTEGIVAIITNHSFMDNPTFRGMRQSLMQTFNQIYVLNLHGSAKKKEKTPEGGNDENIFDIEQGVAISLLVKKDDLSCGIYHADLWGNRAGKYRALHEARRDSITWAELTPSTPFYLFIPQNEELRGEYERGWRVTEIFPVNVLGFQTHRDGFAIDFDKQIIERRVNELLGQKHSDGSLYEKYNIKDNRDWKLAASRGELRKQKDWKKKIIECDYRPFDKRWCFFGSEFMDYPRRELLNHVAWRENFCLVSPRQISTTIWQHGFVSEHPANDCLVSDKTKEANYTFPLYLYRAPAEQKIPKFALFAQDDPFAGKERIENFSKEFRSFVNKQYGHHFSAEDILGYIYAVLHSPAYRKQYVEFLKMDFPRIPFVSDRQTFEEVAKLGWGLIQAHLLKAIPETPKVDITKGSYQVDKPGYDEKHQRLYINQEQYFSPVLKEAWDFCIGSYQVLDKYLKSRKGRKLELDEIETFQDIVKVLLFTTQQMQRIDEIWQP